MAIITPSTPASSEPPSALRSDWRERVISVASACLAVLIVATIAVLMGMA
jgi:hypothetical protein